MRQLLPLLLAAAPCSLFLAQTTAPELDRSALQQRLTEAQSTLTGEQLRAEEDTAVTQMMQSQMQQAKAGSVPAPTPAQRARDEAFQTGMSQALRRLSDEGKTRLAQTSTEPPKAATLEAVNPGPAPQPLVPAPLAAPVDKKKEVIVIAADSMIWDSSQSIMVAVGNVDLKHPEFHLTCEELEVHMKKEKADAKAKEPATAAPAPQGGAMNASSLDKAIARGPKVIVEKQGEDGKIMTGQCRLLIHDGSTQITTLRIWPQVSDGNSMQVADEESCVMVLSPQGTLTTRGRSHAEIVNEKAPTKKEEPKAAPASNGTAPASPAQQ
jgi:hypothetical protein